MSFLQLSSAGRLQGTNASLWRQRRMDTTSSEDDVSEDSSEEEEEEDSQVEEEDDGNGEEEEEEEGDNGTEEYLKGLTNAVLKDRLKKKGLKIGGKKAELINRLMGRDKPKVEEWKKSEAKRLLIRLINDDNSWVHRMSPEDIYKSNPMFENYPLPKFKEYLKCLQKGAADLKEIVGVNEQEIWQELIAFPREEMTDRGYPFWDTHPARALLENDIKDREADADDGDADDGMKPKQLWESREEYKEFPLSVFRGHIYQERRRQREEPGYVHRRNQKAHKMHEDEVNEMKDDWDAKQQNKQEEEMNKMCERWETLRMQENNSS